MSDNRTILPPYKQTSELIFDYLFVCRIPNLGSMSPDYVKHFGVPTTGDKAVDKVLANQKITVAINIATMVGYHKESIPVSIVAIDDVKKIYDYISVHLTFWKEQLEVGINIGNAPIDDLVNMDAFANDVYEHAKHQFTFAMANSLMVRHMSSSMRFSNQTFFAAPTTGIKEIKEEDLPKRVSLAEGFKSRIIGSKIWS
jgi:hypothetical protein